MLAPVKVLEVLLTQIDFPPMQVYFCMLLHNILLQLADSVFDLTSDALLNLTDTLMSRLKMLKEILGLVVVELDSDSA